MSVPLINTLRAAGARRGDNAELLRLTAGEKSRQPISEGISREPRIISYYTGPQKIAKEISFHMTTNDMMVAEHKLGPEL